MKDYNNINTELEQFAKNNEKDRPLMLSQMTRRYTIWKENPTSRPSLIITNDDGNKYHKVAVFKNEESIKVFDKWLEGVLIEFTYRFINKEERK